MNYSVGITMAGAFRSIEQTRRYVLYLGVNWSQELVPVSLWLNDMVVVQHFYFDEVPITFIDNCFPAPLEKLFVDRPLLIAKAMIVVFDLEDPYNAEYYIPNNLINQHLPPDFV